MSDPIKNKTEIYNKSEQVIANFKEPNLLSRLFGHIKNAISPTSSIDSFSLAGRIDHSTERFHINRLHDRLLKVTEKLEEHLDDELIDHVKSALENVTRDFRRIQKRIHATSEEDIACDNWISKAKRWVELDSVLHDRGAVIGTLIKHHFIDMNERIEHDLQVIKDYKSHLLKDLPISSDEKERLAHSLQEYLQPYLESLSKLKAKTVQNIELHKIVPWKDKMDKQRSFLFDKALQIIDRIIATSSFSSEENQVEEMGEEQLALVNQLDDLEKSIAELMNRLSLEGVSEPLMVLWNALQVQVHELYGNLHLTAQLFERLEEIQKDLDKVQ